jgi:hypothetical protein
VEVERHAAQRRAGRKAAKSAIATRKAVARSQIVGSIEMPSGMGSERSPAL